MIRSLLECPGDCGPLWSGDMPGDVGVAYRDPGVCSTRALSTARPQASKAKV